MLTGFGINFFIRAGGGLGLTLLAPLFGLTPLLLLLLLLAALVVLLFAPLSLTQHLLRAARRAGQHTQQVLQAWEEGGYELEQPPRTGGGRSR